MGLKSLSLKRFFYRVYHDFKQVIPEKDRWTLVVSSLGVNVLSLALPIMTLQVYDRILAQTSFSTLAVLTAGVLFVVGLEIILRLCRAYVVGWNSAAYEHKMTCEALNHNLKASLCDIEKVSVGENMQRLSSISRLREFYGGQALAVIIDLPFVAIFIALIWVLAHKLVFVPLVLLGCFLAYALYSGGFLQRKLYQRQNLEQERTNFIIDSLKGIHSIKGNGIESYFQRKYEFIQSHINLMNFKLSGAASTAYNAGSLFSHIMMCSTIAVGAILVVQGQITSGVLVACVLLSGRVMQPIQRALSIWSKYQDFQIAHKKAEEIFGLPLMSFCKGDELGERKGRVELKNVSFRYHENENWIFQNMDMVIPSGAMIAISGLSGCGKTTFLKLLNGIYSPTDGSILIDGVEAAKIPPEKLVEYIGFLPSDSVIFQGSIMENLTMFRDKFEDAAYEISNLLGIDAEVSKLPKGFETILSGGPADPIPPGLKQRISIARALVSKPRLILFDCADRALDKKGYNFMFKLLGQLRHKATIIVVSEDRNLIHLAQNEFELSTEGLKLKGYETVEDIQMTHHEVLR